MQERVGNLLVIVNLRLTVYLRLVAFLLRSIRRISIPRISITRRDTTGNDFLADKATISNNNPRILCLIIYFIIFNASFTTCSTGSDG